MAEKINFEYYYGNEAEQYSFFRIPKTLFTDSNFKNLSVEAKVLYGLLLDRMSLSIRNKWFDVENKVYIIYTIEEIMEVLNWGRNKSIKVMKEIEEIGLLEKKRLGLGKPNLLYIKNFISIVNDKPLEVSKPNSQKFQKQTLGSLKNKPTEVLKEDSSNTDSNNTNFSNTDFNHTTSIDSTTGKEDEVVNSVEKEELKEIIKNNISYEIFEQAGLKEKKQVDIIVNLIVKVLNRLSSVRIGGKNVNYQEIKEKMLYLKYEHIDYVLKYLRNMPQKDIRNINAYLLTLLYNADENIKNREVFCSFDKKRDYDYSQDENIWLEFLKT